MYIPIRTLGVGALVGALAAGAAFAQQAGIARKDGSSFAAAETVAAADKIDRSLRGRSGEVEVVVRLGDAPLLVANGENGKREGALLDDSQQKAYSRTVSERQSAVAQQLLALGGREVARLRIALNAIVISIDAAQLDAIAAIPAVTNVNAIGQYSMDLSETVPYIGAAAAQAAGVTGRGVRVAVLDSGIDYTHRNFGGAGTTAAYAAAYGLSNADAKNTTRDGLFPTAKVVDGFDFVGESWPNGPRTEDPDPIDFEGHGTHVADIVAGRSADGTHRGVAPGASLLAVKVCSAVSSACNGVALLKGVEFALDPNGDGSIADAADVINMSLGSNFGQKEDDLSEASANAVRAGVVVVAAAGNAADRPFIVSSPSTAPGVISVAQTQVPSAKAIALSITSPASIAGSYTNTATLDWAPLGSGFGGAVAFVGRGCNADALLANPAGKVALVDRGTCNISEKVAKLSAAGATGVLVGLVAAGDAVTFSNGGQCPAVPNGTCKPSLVITQSTANRIKANLAAPVTVAVDPAVFVTLAGSIVGSSARGPSMSFSAIKPEIGAPGASVSAIAGTGTGEDAFGGTSGATPMIAGSAALLLQKYPRYSPREIKALLMNTAETTVYTNPATLPGVLAPITRIGAGEVRVDRALASQTAAWVGRGDSAALSFGYAPFAQFQVLEREVKVRNYSRYPKTYTISPSFRYADDEASGAVRVIAPRTLRVGGGETEDFTVRLIVDPSKLPVWAIDGGFGGGNGPSLQSVEYDGYVRIRDGSDDIRLPWHLLPHRAADVDADERVRLNQGAGTLELKNRSRVLEGGVDLFALTGTSPRVPKSQLPQAGDNFTVSDLRAVGVRLNGSFVQFAINTYTRRAHPAYPGEFDVVIDSNADGVDDYVVYSAELGGFGVTGQTVINVVTLATNAIRTVTFADADFQSRNFIMWVPLSAVGLTPTSKFRFSVLAFDNYFTGNLTDAIENMTFTLNQPRYDVTGATNIVASALGDFAVPPGDRSTLDVVELPGGAAASPSQSGLLLMYRDAASPQEAETVVVR
jgi:minor extracellular serine protease Vpr